MVSQSNNEYEYRQIKKTTTFSSNQKSYYYSGHFLNFKRDFHLMKTLISLLVCCFLFISHCKSQDSDYSFKESYTVSLPAKLSVSSSDGNIEVLPSDGKEIQVFYIVKRNNKLLSMDWKELEQKGISADVRHKGNSLEIDIRYPVSSWSFHFLDRIVIHLRILAPQETECRLSTSDGNISLQGLKSDQHIKTNDGNIHVSQVTGIVAANSSDGNIEISKNNGAISASASDGNIRVKEIDGSADIQSGDGNLELADIGGSVKCRASDGNIELKNVRGDINVKTSDGNISFKDVSGSVKAQSGDGSIKGNILQLKNSLDVETGDGNIDIAIPDGLGLDLNIKGESLKVPLKDFSGESTENYIKGKIHGGGISVDLITNDGSIKLEYK